MFIIILQNIKIKINTTQHANAKQTNNEREQVQTGPKPKQKVQKHSAVTQSVHECKCMNVECRVPYQCQKNTK